MTIRKPRSMLMIKETIIAKPKRHTECAKGGKWIQDMHMRKGALHKQLHVPKGQKIPERKLEKASHSTNPKLRKRANLAMTLEKLPKRNG
jgi:hypothetical protein